MQELEECRGSHVYDRRQPAATLPLPVSASRGHSSARAVSGSHAELQHGHAGFSSSAGGRAKGSRLPRQAGPVDRTDRLHSAAYVRLDVKY